MGSSISSDSHSYEVVREYAHRRRVKMKDVLHELVKPLEDRLASEFGIKIVNDKPVRIGGKKVAK